MFSLASGIYQSYFAPPKISILVIGLDGSGKTSLLERIKVTKVDTEVDISSQSQIESLKLKYVKGAVALLEGRSPVGVADSEDENYALRTRGGRDTRDTQNGKPARLPPPLPPKNARKSQTWVQTVLSSDGENVGGVVDENPDMIKYTHSINPPQSSNEIEANLLDMVPPPPFSLDQSDAAKKSHEELSNPSAKAEKKSNAKTLLPISATQTRPPLSRTKVTSTPNHTPRSSFIQLLRCPSPQRYSSAGLEDDEEYQAVSEPTASSLSTETTKEKTVPISTELDGSCIVEEESKDDKVDEDEDWNTDYLKDYYINHQENEEFDLKSATVKMFPIHKIRPTLGQNLAKVDMSGCKCSLFDLSGAEKMRPLWERYYRDTDAIIYVVNSAETSFNNLLQSRIEFQKLCQNDILQRRLDCGLPILIFANQLDLAYREYDEIMERANSVDQKFGRGISWNPEEEDQFVGGEKDNKRVPFSEQSQQEIERNEKEQRVVDFNDLSALFGLQTLSFASQNRTQPSTVKAADSGMKRNIFLFGGSAKSGEGVRVALEYLVAYAKKYHLWRQAR